MQESSITVRYSDQLLITVHNMRLEGFTFPEIAESFNESGLVKALSRNAYNDKDIQQMEYKGYPRMMKRKQPHADQMYNINKMLRRKGKSNG